MSKQLALLMCCLVSSYAQKLPVVVNTWPFINGNEAGRDGIQHNLPLNSCITLLAANAIKSGKSYLDAIEEGCIAVEQDTTVDSVGYGGRYRLCFPMTMLPKFLLLNFQP